MNGNQRAVRMLRGWAMEACSRGDKLAVERALRKIRRQDCGREMLKLTKLVYLSSLNAPMRRGDVSARVHRASISCSMSERTVYRYLKTVCEEIVRQSDAMGA